MRSQDTGGKQTNQKKRMKNIYPYAKIQKKNSKQNKTQKTKKMSNKNQW